MFFRRVSARVSGRVSTGVCARVATRVSAGAGFRILPRFLRLKLSDLPVELAKATEFTLGITSLSNLVCTSSVFRIRITVMASIFFHLVTSQPANS